MGILNVLLDVCVRLNNVVSSGAALVANRLLMKAVATSSNSTTLDFMFARGGGAHLPLFPSCCRRNGPGDFHVSCLAYQTCVKHSVSVKNSLVTPAVILKYLLQLMKSLLLL